MQARNRYVSAWKQLAAAIGRIDLQPSLLDGPHAHSLPALEFDALFAAVMSRNSDVAAAQYAVEKAQGALRLCTLMPLALSLHHGQGLPLLQR